jgi:hypothetical protein
MMSMILDTTSVICPIHSKSKRRCDIPKKLQVRINYCKEKFISANACLIDFKTLVQFDYI